MERYERQLEFATAAGKVTFRVQQGGAGRFYIHLTLPERPQSNDVVLAVPSEFADQLTHAIGKAADMSGE
ncbi:MAG TPA: hypothetical protein VFA89_09300 [Terriglobales bacterium]|nr:hypothetical protein [Terriglobales bacterium]